MKRLALAIGIGVAIGSCALAAGPVQAYQPVEAEAFYADPETVAPGGSFDAVVENCFPGERVEFVNYGPDPAQTAVAFCDVTTYEARVTFQAPDVADAYEIGAILDAATSDNPDIPDRPFRSLEAMYFVEDVTFPIDDGGLGGGFDGATTAISTGGSGDIWPSFMSSVAFYRAFLGLLALLAGIFFVWLWRRRRDDERIQGTSPPGATPTDPSTPVMA